MSFIDLLIENKPGDEIIINGHAGMFSTTFKKNVRILRIYQFIGRDGFKSIKLFKYDEFSGRLYIETYLSYFGNVKFLIKYSEK